MSPWIYTPISDSTVSHGRQMAICRFSWTWNVFCCSPRLRLGVQIRCLAAKTWSLRIHPPNGECWGSCPGLVMLLRTQLPFGHWLFIVGYNVTFDRPPRRQRMPTCADNGHRAFKSADPLLLLRLLSAFLYFSILVGCFSLMLPSRSLQASCRPNGISRWGSNASAPTL